MLVLHGSWMLPHRKSDARFVLWGEDLDLYSASARRRQRLAVDPSRSRAHPYGAAADALRAAFAAVGGVTPESPATPVLVRAPSAAGQGPLPSASALWPEPEPDAPPPVGAPWRVDALLLDVMAAVAALPSLDGEGAPEGIRLGDDLEFWVVAARFALDLLVRQRVFPTIQRDKRRYVARWRPLYDEWPEARRFGALLRAMPPACRALAWRVQDGAPAPEDLLNGFLDTAVDAIARRAMATVQPPRQRWYGGEAWIEGLSGDGAMQRTYWGLDSLYQQYRAWAGGVAGLTSREEAYRLCLRLDPPIQRERGAGSGEPGNGETGTGNGERAGLRLVAVIHEGDEWDAPDTAVSAPAAPADTQPPTPDTPSWTLHYLLQSTDDPSLLIPAEDVWRMGGAPAGLPARRGEHPQDRLLIELGRVAELLPAAAESLHQPAPAGYPMTTAEAYAFLRESAVRVQAAGFGVLLPEMMTKLGLRLRLGRPGESKAAAGESLGMFGVETLVNFDWQLALGGETMSREEFEELARRKEPLVQVRGQWVELQPELVEQALAFFKKQDARGRMSIPAALRMALAPDGEFGLPVEEVDTEGWFDDLLHRLADGGGREEVEQPAGFHGELRPYQKVGVSWMASLRKYALGACLADDMGLGKTIEVAALLLRDKEQGTKAAPSLIICPTSVVGNWRHELARFAPDLRVMVHHGAAREREEFAARAAENDVVISTYALLPRDEQELSSVPWSDVILDEAQNIKNPATKAAQTARRLPTAWRAALTGTPVENRLSDLWSIFQFLNPGYLGSGDEFRRRFSGPIERNRDAAAAAQLKALVSPFILRRLKTDRAIIADLPEKNEMKVFCTLTKEQATLYQAVVQDSLRRIESAEGFARRGEILAALTRLKQVCNHPAQFLHDGSRLAGRSGKLTRLTEMLDEALAEGDRALVFTQFAQMGTLLQQHLAATLDREVLFLHGGTPAPERDRMVAAFQAEGDGPPVFVLSIKAGGTGLNLTRANHVFHYDRWWNPAVENQATDRAFRIGQRRDVQVHKYICSGTLEETIDALIERKVELSEAIVGTNESWITEMSTEQLRDLFLLRRADVDMDEE